VRKIKGLLDLMVGINWLCTDFGDGPQSHQIKELMDLSMFYYENGKYDESIKFCKKALSVKKTGKIYNNLGLSYLAKDQLEKASRAFTDSMRIDGSCAQALYNLSMVMYYAGHFDKTIDFLSHIIKWPGVPPLMLINAHNDTGCAYIKKGDYENAAKSFEKLIVLDSKFERAYVNLGNAYCEQDKLDDAINQFNKAIEINQNCSAAYNGIGVVHFNKDEIDQSLSYFDKASKFSPPSIAASINSRIIKKYISQNPDVGAIQKNTKSKQVTQ